MKQLICASAFALLMLTLLPISADAFSRRSHHSEVTPSQHATLHNNTTQSEGGSVSAQAVPEPPSMLLMTIGVGLFALYAVAKRFRRHA
jgi:hypothetical protein